MVDKSEYYNKSNGTTPLYLQTQFIEKGIDYCKYLGSICYPLTLLPTKGHKDYGISSILRLPWSEQEVQDDLSNKYLDIVRLSGDNTVEETNETNFKVVRYLLSQSACLVEVPKWKTTGGVKEPTYDKFIGTTNPDIAIAFLGGADEKTYNKYKTKIQEGYNEEERTLIILKLTYTSEGTTKITVPRKPIKVDNIICTPICFLLSYLQGFVPHLGNNILRVTYLKDNNTIRQIDTSTNEQILLNLYTEQEYVISVLNHIHILGMVDNKISSKLMRGYISVPELGASRYDSTGTRAINLTRIVNIANITENDIDKTYIDVDLEAVPIKFKQAAFVYVNSQNSDILAQILSSLEKNPLETYTGKSAQELYNILDKFIDTYTMYYGTAALRSLHLFLINNPTYFPKYIGKRLDDSVAVVNSNKFEVGTLQI